MKTSRFLTAAVVLGSIVVAIVSISVVEAAPPVCPKIYAPVICDDGKVYVNQCYADRHHAQNCVPYGGGL